jgi:hypothetical protein
LEVGDDGLYKPFSLYVGRKALSQAEEFQDVGIFEDRLKVLEVKFSATTDVV